MTQLLKITCPDYKFGKALSLEKVSQCIDDALIKYFKDKDVVIRGIQSEKHNMPKEKLIEQILRDGFDRNAPSHKNEVAVSDKHIDLFGYRCVIKQPPVVLPTLEGFHKWKPKSLERPQRKVDIWMIYDAKQLDNVEYNHSHYGVKAKDGYVFKDPKRKQDTLLGIIVIE